MSRTYRKGWGAVTGSDADNRGIKHHATNDWFSENQGGSRLATNCDE